MSLDLSELLVTQNGLRKECQLLRMIAHVKGGGVWTQEALDAWSSEHPLVPRKCKLIQVSVFEDGHRYLHDGHHRSVATWLGGRRTLREGEYEIKEWRYADYLEFNPRNHWYTPFDPRTECRLPDLRDFFDAVKALGEITPNTTSQEVFARDNRRFYVERRRVRSVPDLAESLSPALAFCSSEKILEEG